MAEYTVECVDRESGHKYRVRVDAPSADDAIAFVSKEHIAGRAIPDTLDDSSTHAAGPVHETDANTPSEIAADLRLLAEQVRLLQNIASKVEAIHAHQRSAMAHLAQAIAYSVVFVIVAAVAGFLAAGLFGGRV